jgi:alkylhydroperoxidase family enzyme
MSSNNAVAPAIGKALPLAAELAVLENAAPQVHSALRTVCKAAVAGVDAELLKVTRTRVEIGLGTTEEPGDEGLTRLAAAAAELTDQFLVYVPGVTESMLEPLRSELGEAGLAAFVQALYVLDQTTRLRLIYAQLFEGDYGTPAAVADAPVLPMDEALAALHAATMRLSSLDPLTSEIVRLRAGTYHKCRLCTSIRLQDKGASVVDEDLASRIERNDISGMSAEHQVAIRYADAHMVNPKAIGQDLISELGRHYSHAQLVELSLDVSQWNQQKILVALGTDTPVSDTGLTPLMFDDEGHIVHGEHGSLG